MRYRTRTILLAVCLTVSSVVLRGVAQERPPQLRPNQPVTFSLSPDEAKLFTLQMKRDGFAEITWLANDNLILVFRVLDSSGKALAGGDSTENDSALSSRHRMENIHLQSDLINRLSLRRLKMFH